MTLRAWSGPIFCLVGLVGIGYAAGLGVTASGLAATPTVVPVVLTATPIVLLIEVTRLTTPEPSATPLPTATDVPKIEASARGERPVTRRYTADDVAAALVMASARTRCIVGYESPSMDPYAVGDNGESHGVAQIHDRGLRPLFNRWSNGGDPTNPYQAVAFVDWALGQGLAAHWTPVLRGLC